MPEQEQPENIGMRIENIDMRILEELTFIAGHLISVENLLREMLHRMDGQTTDSDSVRIP